MREGTGELLFAILPLCEDVSRGLAAELIRDGFGKLCGECEKPFTAARKWRSIGRVTHVDPAGGGLYSTAWLLCGRCASDMRASDMRANGNRVSSKLIEEARAATDAAMTLLEPARGNA